MGDVHDVAAAQTKAPPSPFSHQSPCPPPPPLDPVAAVEALPYMLHLPKKTLNQGRVEQINQRSIAPKKQGFRNVWWEYFHRSHREESQKYFQYCPLTLKHMILWGCERSQDCSDRGCRSSCVWASWLIYAPQSAGKIIADSPSQTGNQRDGDSN